MTPKAQWQKKKKSKLDLIKIENLHSKKYHQEGEKSTQHQLTGWPTVPDCLELSWFQHWKFHILGNSSEPGKLGKFGHLTSSVKLFFPLHPYFSALILELGGRSWIPRKMIKGMTLFSPAVAGSWAKKGEGL